MDMNALTPTVISIIALALALSLGFFIVIIAILINLLSKIHTKKQKEVIEQTQIKKIVTTGKHLNKYYQILIYFIAFAILVVFLILATFTFQANIRFIDIWPFLFLVVVLLIFSLTLIDRARSHSKRIAQRDMREL